MAGVVHGLPVGRATRIRTDRLIRWIVAIAGVALLNGSTRAAADAEIGQIEFTYKHQRSCSPDALRARHVRYEPYVLEAASRYGLPAALLRAVIRVESDYSARAVSRAGALGLMQVMPVHFGLREGDGFDPRFNLLVGASLLRRLVDHWNGSLVLALASYNAGSGAVRRYRGVPPFPETRRYVAKVIRHYHAYRAGRLLLRR